MSNYNLVTLGHKNESRTVRYGGGFRNKEKYKEFMKKMWEPKESP